MLQLQKEQNVPESYEKMKAGGVVISLLNCHSSFIHIWLLFDFSMVINYIMYVAIFLNFWNVNRLYYSEYMMILELCMYHLVYLEYYLILTIFRSCSYYPMESATHLLLIIANIQILVF